MSSWFVWKQRLWGFLTALAAIVLIVAGAAFNAWLDTHHFKLGLPPWEEERPVPHNNSGGSAETVDSIQNQSDNQVESGQNSTADTSLVAAIKYLDGNSTWKKSDMEKYSDLEGLYEDMNNFNLSQLLNKWSTKLASSQKFKEVCKSANNTFSNKWNPRQGSHNPTYNKPNDEQISVENYINWLDRDQTPKASNNGGGFHSETGASNTRPKVGNSGSPKQEQGNRNGFLPNNSNN